MRLEQLVIGRRQPVCRRVCAKRRGNQLRDFALPGQRQVGRRAEEFVSRLPGKIFGHDPGTGSGRQGDLVLQGLGRQFDGDVSRAVADAHHQDSLSGQRQRCLRVDVVVGVDGRTGEGAREVRESRIPVVTVAHDQQVELPHRTGLVLDRPEVAIAPGVHDAVAEFDVLQQPEGVGVVIEVVLDVGVVRERRELVGNRKVLERQPMFGGVDVQRAICAAVAVGISECPVAADAVGGLERGVRHAVVLEHLAGRQTADARADDRGAGPGSVHGASLGLR